MNWYQTFNTLEAGLWVAVAVAIPLLVRCENPRQRWAVALACTCFLAFGASDWLEAQRQAAIPLWLWGLKDLCGGGIFVARYAWLGWSRFCWRDREVIFGALCLSAVVGLICLQRALAM